MSISHIVTLGFGNGTLEGSPSLIVTLGFGDGGGGVETDIPVYASAEVSAIRITLVEVEPNGGNVVAALTKGVSNRFRIRIEDEDDAAYDGLTGVTLYLIGEHGDDVTGPKVGVTGETDWEVTETATPGTYEGRIPKNAAMLLDRDECYRAIVNHDLFTMAVKDANGDGLLFTVQ